MLAPIIFTIVTFCVVILICTIIYFFIQRGQNLKYQSQRLEQAVTVQAQEFNIPSSEQAQDQQQVETDPGTLRRDTRISSIPWLNDLMSNTLKTRAKSLMILIEQSGLKIRVAEFLLFTIFISLLGAALVSIFFHVPLVGIFTGILPFFILKFLKTKRLEAFIAQMPQALDMLSSDLRAGLDVQAGLKHLSEEFSAPIGEEFGKVVVEVNLGLTLAEALNNLSTRINTMEVQILCTGIIINRELGGNLSELVGSVGNTIRERFKLKGMIRALTAENQMSGYLLIALPFVLFFLLNFLSPATYGSFSSNPLGQKIIIGCLVSMSFGYLIMNKITQLEV